MVHTRCHDLRTRAAVLVGPGFLLLFTLRQRQKLSGEDERDVTEADIPGLQAAELAADRPGGTGTVVQPSASQHPGARVLAVAAVAFLTGFSIGRRQHGAQRGRRP
jgi:hypothetical protein